MRLWLLVAQNLLRNPLRTILTMLGTMMLVMVVTLVWSILTFLDQATAEKANNLKAIITERWRIPSQMPLAYAASLSDAAAQKPSDYHPLDSMTWSFLGGSLDPDKRTRENSLFAFCLDPKKLLTMMDDLDTLSGEQLVELRAAVDKMSQNRQGIMLGRDRLAAINKRLGDRFVVHSFNYKDINLEVEIVGVFPDGRYNNSAAINIDYLTAAMDAYPQSHAGQKHPMASKSLNLVWLRVEDMNAFQQAATQIMSAPFYSAPAVKIETQASGISTFLEAYRDIVWGMRWLLSPAILVTLSLVISNAISISVRERQQEFAVMKVLGFSPDQILLLVLGESIVLGLVSGLASASLTLWVVNVVYGGLKFPIAFFGAFLIPNAALIWGPALGIVSAVAGCFLPAWQARSVRVSDVFARIN